MRRGRTVRARKAAFVVAFLLALEGCASVAVSAVGMAGSAALDRVLNGDSYQVVPAPIAGARLAALRTIRRMGMTVESDARSGGRWTILTATKNQKSKIEIRAIDYKRSRMDVKVSWDQLDFVKDPEVANEFIRKTVAEVSRITFRRIQIATAQLLLANLGYGTKNPNGIMDGTTRNAIRGFQRKIKIPADGEISNELVAKLRLRHERLTPFPDKHR